MSEPRPTPVPPSPPDLAALLAVQQRLFEAFARSGRIVAEAARGCAERQAAIARMTLDDLLAGSLPGEPAASLQERAARLGSLLEQIGREVGALQRILAEAQLAMLEELRRAWQPAVEAAAEGERMPAAEPTPTAEAPVAEAPVTEAPTAAAERHAVPTVAAETPAATPIEEAAAGPAENGEAAKKSPARRGRKIAANG